MNFRKMKTSPKEKGLILEVLLGIILAPVWISLFLFLMLSEYLAMCPYGGFQFEKQIRTCPNCKDQWKIPGDLKSRPLPGIGCRKCGYGNSMTGIFRALALLGLVLVFIAALLYSIFTS
jgi:hypothetical protein